MSSSYVNHADSNHIQIEQAKLRLLRALPEGRDNAIPGTKLAERVPQKATTVRDMIPELRNQYGVPVGSCSDGYYIVVSPDELARQIERYDSQIETAQRRKRELTEAFNAQRYNE